MSNLKTTLVPFHGHQRNPVLASTMVVMTMKALNPVSSTWMSIMDIQVSGDGHE